MVHRWPPFQVTSLKYGLDSLADLVDKSHEKAIDPEIQSWLSRLLVIRSCGYLEQVVTEVFRDYVRNKSGGLVRSFAHSWLERSRNPSPDNLTELVGRFDSSICNEFTAMLDGDDGRLRREVGFLVDRRNRIAHGLSEGITQSKALQLKDIACELADWFILRFNPERGN
jgi:hypothetical protein